MLAGATSCSSCWNHRSASAVRRGGGEGFLDRNGYMRSDGRLGPEKKKEKMKRHTSTAPSTRGGSAAAPSPPVPPHAMAAGNPPWPTPPTAPVSPPSAVAHRLLTLARHARHHYLPATGSDQTAKTGNRPVTAGRSPWTRRRGTSTQRLSRRCRHPARRVWRAGRGSATGPQEESEGGADTPSVRVAHGGCKWMPAPPQLVMRRRPSRRGGPARPHPTAHPARTAAAAAAAAPKRLAAAAITH